MLCEKELLLKVAEGDKAAFSALFNANYRHLGAHIYRITNSITDTEEVVQDVFLKIWTNRNALAGVQDFKAYLYVLSKNHALNVLKKTTRERTKQTLIKQHMAVMAPINDENDDYYYSLIDEAIDHLPAQQQRVYLMSRHERLKYEEIALRLNISRETVKKYLQIATSSITTYVMDKSNANSLPAILLYIFINNL